MNFDREIKIAKQTKDSISTVKIDKISCAGTAYSATCPECGKFHWLGGSEINSLSVVCICGTKFLLER
jgi:hypothetical protein